MSYIDIYLIGDAFAFGLSLLGIFLWPPPPNEALGAILFAGFIAIFSWAGALFAVWISLEMRAKTFNKKQ